jgi:hypothetical protein
MAGWRDWVTNRKPEVFDSEKAFVEDTRIVGDNIGLKSPSSDSIVRVSSDGKIDIFAKSNLGIRIDPHSNSIQFHAPKMHFYANDYNVYTSNILGFRWNTMPFNASAVTPGLPALLPPADIPARIVSTLKDIVQDLTNI